jgi:hypothetical protein
MADLMTRIAADDSQFQGAMSRIDSRIASAGATMKRVSGAAKSLFTGFGAAAVVSQIGGIVRGYIEMQDQMETNRSTLQRLTSDAVRSALDQVRALKGIKDAYGEIGDAQLARQRAIGDEAERQIMQIGMMNAGELLSLWLADGKSPAQIMQELVKQAQNAQNTIARITPRLTQAQAQVDTNAAEKQRADAVERGRAEIRDMIREARTKYDSRRAIGDRFEDEGVSSLRDSGRDREAEIEANRLRFSRFRRDIEESEILSAEERAAGVAAIRAREQGARDAIEARFASDARMSARDGFQAVGVGGATFAQQMSLQMAEPMKAIAQNTRETADRLGEIGRKLDYRRGFSTYE